MGKNNGFNFEWYNRKAIIWKIGVSQDLKMTAGIKNAVLAVPLMITKRISA